MYSNISQILLLYKVLGYYNKFDSRKSLEVYYWYVKKPRCGYVEHGLEYYSYYVKKHTAHMAACSGLPTGSRRAARRARISETRLLTTRDYDQPTCKWTRNHTFWGLKIISWGMHSKSVFKVWQVIPCSSFYVKEFDVIVPKNNIFLV